MSTVITTSKVMHNNTICITQAIRKHLDIKRGDYVILTLEENGDVKLSKAVHSLEGLAGLGKESFTALGGGEAFLKKERKNWEK